MSPCHPPTDIDQKELRPVCGDEEIAAFRTDLAAAHITACNDAFLRMVRVTSRDTIHLSDLVTHLLWLVSDLVPQLGGSGDVAEDDLRLYSDHESDRLSRRLWVTAVRTRAGGEDGISCLVKDITAACKTGERAGVE